MIQNPTENTLGTTGYLDKHVSSQKNKTKEGTSNFHKFIQLNKDDKMYALCTLLSLGAITYGLTNGFVTGDFTQAKFGTGLLGMCNLIKGNLSDDDQTSKTCIKLGSIASIIFILSSVGESAIYLSNKGNPLKCTPSPESILQSLKKAWNITS